MKNRQENQRRWLIHLGMGSVHFREGSSFRPRHSFLKGGGGTHTPIPNSVFASPLYKTHRLTPHMPWSLINLHCQPRSCNISARKRKANNADHEVVGRNLLTNPANAAGPPRRPPDAMPHSPFVRCPFVNRKKPVSEGVYI